MLKNQSQKTQAEAKVKELRAAEESATDDLSREVLGTLRSSVECEVREFDAIVEGYSTAFEVMDFNDLWDALVKARLARNLTQADLAHLVGVKPQQIQRYEAGGYSAASGDRVADIADVLEYELHGCFRPALEEPRWNPSEPSGVNSGVAFELTSGSTIKSKTIGFETNHSQAGVLI